MATKQLAFGSKVEKCSINGTVTTSTIHNRPIELMREIVRPEDTSVDTHKKHNNPHSPRSILRTKSNDDLTGSCFGKLKKRLLSCFINCCGR